MIFRETSGRRVGRVLFWERRKWKFRLHSYPRRIKPRFLRSRHSCMLGLYSPLLLLQLSASTTPTSGASNNAGTGSSCSCRASLPALLYETFYSRSNVSVRWRGRPAGRQRQLRFCARPTTRTLHAARTTLGEFGSTCKATKERPPPRHRAGERTLPQPGLTANSARRHFLICVTLPARIPASCFFLLADGFLFLLLPIQGSVTVHA
jgi:hypothetical protein